MNRRNVCLYMKRLFIFLSLCLLTALPARANIIRSAHTEVELVPEVLSIQPGGSFWVALRMKMDEHWHTYWRNSGDSGLPTQIEWTLPEGISASELHWPFPQKVDLPSVSVYAYKDEVLLLTEMRVSKDLPAGGKVRMEAHVTWLECEINCIPGEADLDLELPVLDTVPVAAPGWVEAFAETRSRLPVLESEWKVEAFADGKNLSLLLETPEWVDYPPGEIEFFPYSGDLIDHGAKQSLAKTARGYRLDVKRIPWNDSKLDSISGILVSREGWRGRGSERALEITLPVKPLSSLPPAAAQKGMVHLPLALLFAFLGGLILNLMPCVLPVLSLKILNFVEQASEQKTRPWLHGFVFAAGVLVSFWVLAGVLLFLRAGGEQIGWGFQLQSSGFVVVLAVLFLLLSLNLFGVFEIGTSLTGLGGALFGKSGLRYSFASGVLATIVATPCTAPFMGSALGFALTQPAAVSMGVFTALGLGMAAPYVVLASFPGLLKFVPKPGPWMIRLKQAMGGLLFLTVLWLVWVFSLQRGGTAAAVLAGGLVLGGAGTAVWSRRKHFLPAGVLIFAGLAGVLLPLGMSGAGQGHEAVSGKIEWVPFSAEDLEAYRSEGRPVFIDFTAAWCLSCQVNDRLVFASDEVRNLFRDQGVVPMKADWTRRDEKVTRALASFGRSSIPLYVWYARDGAEPVILPELITPRIVMDTIMENSKER